MAKNAEDRYQIALGLKHDLERCLSEGRCTEEISSFELGQRDISDRFLIPEKLYGREAETQALLNAFDRVAQGQTEMMLVAGFSGIGKTAVVNKVYKPIYDKSDWQRDGGGIGDRPSKYCGCPWGNDRRAVLTRSWNHFSN